MMQTASSTDQMSATERERAIESAGIPDPDDRDGGGPLGGR
jgi:hypothetical protein